MSNANVAFVQELYAAFGRGDIGTLAGAATPETTWRVNGRKSDHPLLTEFKGPAGVQQFFKTLSETQDALAFAPRDFYAADDKVFVLGHYTWSFRKTKVKAESDFIHIFTVKNNKLMSFLEFTDTAQFADGMHGVRH